MADIFDESKRSEVMSKVGTEDTELEMLVRKRLWNDGYRYRTNVKDISGEPDICHKGNRLAVFIDGCFWHGCPECNPEPESNSEFWENKFKDNRERRDEVRNQLLQDDWIVLEYWEHEIETQLESIVDEIESYLGDVDG